MSVRGIERLLEQWEMGVKDVHRRVITVANASGAGTLARRLVAGPRMDRLGGGRGAGTGPAHHRKMGRRLR